MVQPWCILPLTFQLSNALPRQFCSFPALGCVIPILKPVPGFTSPTVLNPSFLLPTHISPTSHPPPLVPVLPLRLPTSFYLLPTLVEVSPSIHAQECLTTLLLFTSLHSHCFSETFQTNSPQNCNKKLCTTLRPSFGDLIHPRHCLLGCNIHCPARLMRALKQ